MICRTFSCAVPYSSASCRLRQGTALRASPDSDAGRGDRRPTGTLGGHTLTAQAMAIGEATPPLSGTRLVPLVEDSCVSRTLGASR